MSAISYDIAALLIAAALRRSAEIDCPMSVAVVDDTRELVAFARMPGAPVITAEAASAKAFTAFSLSAPTHVFHEQTGVDSTLRGLEVLGGGRLCLIGGGLPITVGGVVVGAIGASGGAVEQDVDVAEHGIADVVEMLMRRDTLASESS
jgi:uncharacterized protein GlcG (DUF336 family)